LAQTWVLFASIVQACAASLLETKARLEFDARERKYGDFGEV